MASKTSPFEAGRRTPESKLPLYLGVAIVSLLAGMYYYLNYTQPSRAADVALTAEGKAYTKNLKLEDVTMKATADYFGNKIIEIEGKIGNAGDRPLATVEIYCVFYDGYRQLVLRDRLAIVSRKMGGLKPGETKTFRLPFDKMPDSWNQEMPQLVIAGLTFS